ncbi:hypothetical protein L6164_007717 [Bauhinia variegata]|uniref:Uncharacterized protein n=1 Tax=Bauhinia variegata TaxID=167791 RepID=A0ACB9PER5_BAUVA|nr:hypothetical protein L6164_007717 [Bauhinia variegata]
MSNLILSNSSLTRGDKTTIKGLKYNRSNQDILVDVDSWINPLASVPIYPLTELSRLVKKVVTEGSFNNLLEIAKAVATTLLNGNDYISAIGVSVKVENPREADADSTDYWGAEVFRYKGNI